MELVILMGVQASGKTTWFRETLAATHVHLSLDLLRNVKRPRARLIRDLEDALAAGRDVCVDNTSPELADRVPIIAAGRRHGARVRGVFFEASLAEAWARNERREGRARVPEVGFRTTAARLVPPTLAEGFDVLERLRLGPAGFERLETP